ncbi:MAG: hypothetical protein EAZ92_03380 [Candidatus Kapaibacterium sp.]|nr:MAG: hypothetical protein EAZ92_03380 [Candidatus Kapabacteria bacterium]
MNFVSHVAYLFMRRYVLLLCSVIFQLFAQTSALPAQNLTPQLLPVVQRLTPEGDTLVLQERLLPVRWGAFAAGETGTDIGGLLLPIDLNAPSLRMPYMSNGFTNAGGFTLGLEGGGAITPVLEVCARVAVLQRTGLFNAELPQMPLLSYRNAIASTLLRGLQASMYASYKLSGVLGVYAGANALVPLLAQSELNFINTSSMPLINDRNRTVALPASNPAWGVFVGGQYLWRVRETPTSHLQLAPFLEFHWQPHISETENIRWSAVMMRLGVSLSITPKVVDTLEKRPQARPQLEEQKAIYAQRPRIIEATQLPNSTTNDSLLAEQVFIYNTPTDAEVLTRLQEFIHSVIPDFTETTHVRLLMTCPQEEIIIAEKRVKEVRARLIAQNIFASKIESSIQEKSLLQTAHRLRVQILR